MVDCIGDLQKKVPAKLYPGLLQFCGDAITESMIIAFLIQSLVSVTTPLKT